MAHGSSPVWICLAAAVGLGLASIHFGALRPDAHERPDSEATGSVAAAGRTPRVPEAASSTRDPSPTGASQAVAALDDAGYDLAAEPGAGEDSDRHVPRRRGAPPPTEAFEAPAAPLGSSTGGAAVAAAAVGPLAPELVVSGLVNPIFATAVPGDPRLFVVERAGRVRIVVDGAVRDPAFLDISSRVGTAGEGGLLSIAFDPDHPFNGLFYAFYTNLAGDTVLSRFGVDADPNVADASIDDELLVVGQPAGNHNGGTVAFSPVDGHLYLGLGDGGGGNDPDERAQDGADLLGKMLRLDVSGGPGTPYAIPADNPFVLDPAVLDEIWALGLRNPFRFAFDWTTGDLWIGDVGQKAREEVDFELAGDAGHNYGWDVKEGFIDSPAGDDALPPYINLPFTDPIHDYTRAGGRCSITGGSVYRGPLAAEDGLYFFGDYCTGQIYSLDASTTPATVVDRSAELVPAALAPLELVAIGEGGFGALYVVHLMGGSVYRLGPSGMECADGVDNDADGSMDFGADPGCADAADPSELDTETPCDDGYDNDADGAIDFPADSDCPSATSAAELPPAPPGGGGGGSNGGGGGGSGCGLGCELILLLPPLFWLRGHRRRPRPDRG